MQEVRRARLSYENSKQAKIDKKAREFEKSIEDTKQRLETALKLLKLSIEDWAVVVRDPSDLGALGVLNYFCYDYLKAVALDIALESGHWSIRF